LAVFPLRDDDERVECAASDPCDSLDREGNDQLGFLCILKAPLLQQQFRV
jgi:hypothetical protein